MHRAIFVLIRSFSSTIHHWRLHFGRMSFIWFCILVKHEVQLKLIVLKACLV